MASKVLLVLALCAVGAFCEMKYEKLDGKVLLERQKQLMELYSNIHEPMTDKKCMDIAKSWTIDKNLGEYRNVTAAKQFATMIQYKWLIPRSVPYSPFDGAHNAETFSLFHVFYSAKTYDSFYKTAVYVRDIVNEGLFVYVLSVAILYRPDTQGIAIPPIYEIFPSYFNYGEAMNTALKVNSLGKDFAMTYPSVESQGDKFIINGEGTYWPYTDAISPIKYFTNDYSLNAAYYYYSLMYPSWLSKSVVSGIEKDRRGEAWWFMHKQILARYYLERLSAGLGEIPEINDVVSEGYSSGLVYENGIPYPSRPDDFSLYEGKFAFELEQIKEFEHRLWDSIEKGFYIDRDGKQVNLLTDDGLDTLGYLIQANIDSPNYYYYKNFLNLWYSIVGNSKQQSYKYHHKFSPLFVPSALQNHQTALRDPAFYMIWKRVLRLFQFWQKRMHMYTPEQLAAPGVSIEKVETDQLMTFFDKTFMNVTNYLSKNTAESVMVSHPRLNHKPFSFRVLVKSDAAKKVVVKFFLAPKYDSEGNEIPLHKNTENFYLMDEFVTELTAGENTIVRKSTSNDFAVDDWSSASEVYQKVLKGQWTPDADQSLDGIPQRLLLPKGRMEGMPFQLVTYIQDFKEPKTPYGTGFDWSYSLGLGTGARYLTDYPMGYPADRTLIFYQVAGLKNFNFQTVKIYHQE